MRQNGIPVAHWKLDYESYEYLVKFFTIEPAKYQVQTRKYLFGVRGFPRILKTLNWAAQKGKANLLMELSPKDKKVLDEADIPYKPVRFDIVLLPQAK